MGQIPHRADILSISNANPCVITTTEEHGYASRDFVRLSNLATVMPPPKHGMDPLNNYRFRIIVTGLDTFKIQDPITFKDIDSTNYTPYTEGGFCNLIETNFFFHGDDEE